MAKKLTILEFFKRYPDEDTCLDHVMEVRYGKHSECPKCGKETTFYRITKRPAYACEFCGHHVYPMAGTPFENTRTPLQMWFYAIYLFTTTKHGVPAKELQRQLGVTYKTAWRMAREIRAYMGEVDGNPKLGGHVEIDETYVGGKPRGPMGRQIGPRSRKHRPSRKQPVFGIVEREGRIMTQTVPNAHKKTLFPIIKDTVEPGSKISTDALRVYSHLSDEGYTHDSVDHQVEYVNGDTHTNTLECFWSHFKCSVKGTHRAISRQHMNKYLGEFEYRFNRRHLSSCQMLDELLQAF